MNEDAFDARDLVESLICLHVRDDAARQYEILETRLALVVSDVLAAHFLEHPLEGSGHHGLWILRGQVSGEKDIVRKFVDEVTFANVEQRVYDIAKNLRIFVGCQSNNLALVTVRLKTQR